MNNFQNQIKLLINVLFFIILGIGTGILMLSSEMKPLLDELSEVRASDVIGVFGTTYALITAFILVNAWTHFNDTNKSITNENKAIISLWNNTDFLEDVEVSMEMNTALLDYIKEVLYNELPALKAGKKVDYPINEFISIMKVIDKIEFDDPRDPIAFQALISSYKDLSDARNARLDNILSRIPFLLKIFYIFASFIFWFGYLIEGFESELLYMIVLILVTIITVLAYAIIFDLDKTLDGSLQVSIDSYQKTIKYIESTKHEVFADFV